MKPTAPRSALLLTLLLACGLLLAACGDKPAPNAEQPEDHDEHEHAAKHGGALVESGDHAVHFEVKYDLAAGLAQIWVYDADMQPLATEAAPVIQLASDSGGHKITGLNPSGSGASSEWHFSHDALEDHVHGRLRWTHGGTTYNTDLPDVGHDDHDGHEHDGEEHDDHDGHDHDGKEHDDHAGHEHDAHEHEDHKSHAGGEGHDHPGHEGEGPHHGVVQPFAGADGKEAGHLELKLHDDKGDLELWIATDERVTKPHDLPIASEITITFVDRESRKVTLAARNTDKNQDEDGTANNRDGKTNYFIFPGATGADAAWLQGKDFSCSVIVSFTAGGTAYTTKPFVLTPHQH